jgi:MoaA/NifB/PqqE/SkfB family radical SAM enzyme
MHWIKSGGNVMKEELLIKNWDWEITRQCNLDCLHCILGSNNHLNEQNTAEALSAVSTIAKLGGEVLRITGGEPLTRKDIGLILKKASACNVHVELITNGLMISDIFLQEFGKYIRHIAVSIDGQENSHDYIRGKGTFKKSSDALDLIMRYSIDTSVSITIHALNEFSVGKSVEELALRGIRRFHLNEINHEGNTRKNSQLMLCGVHPHERFAEILSQLQDYIEIDECDITTDTSCTISSNSVYLGCDGALHACAELALIAPEQRIGYIFEDDIKEKAYTFFEKMQSQMPQQCRYHSFTAPGINICLNLQDTCPIIKEVAR